MSDAANYDPRTYAGLTWFDRPPEFAAGRDSPRDYLERCLDVIGSREQVVQAYACLNEDGAREAADASAARWQRSQPLSPIDGMPISIKDLLETRDMPTEMGCAAYRGNFPKRDNAAVSALRAAGAVILGKTITAEIGGSHPGPTTNPFDPARTPGGSSSGSAAAVAAGMVPAAIGSQVGGSIIRPSGFCGNVALKPSQGGINRGERQATSMSTHGVHANAIEDMWQVAIEIANRVGGDRGFMGLQGPAAPPTAVPPLRLAVLETEGWTTVDAPTRAAFEALCDALEASGIALIRRADHPLLEALEAAVADATRVTSSITGWENRWSTRNLVDQYPDGVSERAKQVLAKAEAMTIDDYRALLVVREQAQAAHRAVAGLADALVTLSCPGPAPHWAGDQPGQPLASRPTGNAIFNYPTSLLFAPCVSLPLLGVSGLPVGVQIVGQREEDARMTALGRWIVQHVTPQTAA
ncbi:MAG: amidase [Pseudomonadota bacterium]